MYKLQSINLDNLRGPINSEYISTNWTRYFTTLKKAKSTAETDHGKKIDWRETDGQIHSHDLPHIMYNIKELTLEN